jgi:hypothetical protein
MDSMDNIKETTQISRRMIEEVVWVWFVDE